MNAIQRRRLNVFKANKGSYYSFCFFLGLIFVSFLANFIANDVPLFFVFQGDFFLPVLFDYTEMDLGEGLAIFLDYKDPYIIDLIQHDGFMVWPLIPFSYDTIQLDLAHSAPTPPTLLNWLGTDDQGRDVLARLLYGIRISILFSFLLTFFSYVIGIFIGAMQGYYGGLIDLIGQRILEIWSGIPVMFLLIILSSFIAPSFVSLLLLLTLFNWMGLVDLVRAEFLKNRDVEYVQAAKLLGLSDFKIIFKHLLPNSIVSSLTFLPFMFAAALTMLTALDFLGFGLPSYLPSLGEMIAQAKNNLHAPWLSFTSFISLSILLILLVFIGEGLRSAFDPRGSK